MLKLHEIETFNKPEYFRRMKVASGYLYNFWNYEKDDYLGSWVFVPNVIEDIEKLKHHKDATAGLWATDKPDLVDDPKNVLFQITE